MTKKKLAVSIAAVALAVATIFTGSNLPSVKAADVADKAVMELGADGDYQEKKLTTADTQAIANQMGYGYFGGDVLVCGNSTQAYIDWEKAVFHIGKHMILLLSFLSYQEMQRAI